MVPIPKFEQTIFFNRLVQAVQDFEKPSGLEVAGIPSLMEVKCNLKEPVTLELPLLLVVMTTAKAEADRIC